MPACQRFSAEASGEPVASSAASATLPVPSAEHRPQAEALKSKRCSDCQAAQCSGFLLNESKLCVDGKCDEYRQCLLEQGCANEQGANQPCYCGETDMTECFLGDKTPTGKCKQAAEKLAGQTVPLEVGYAWMNPKEPFGAVNQRWLCMQEFCLDSCFR